MANTRPVPRSINGKTPNKIKETVLAHMDAGRTDAALHLVTDLLFCRENDYMALNYAGQIYHDKGQLDAALGCYQRAYTLYQDDPALLSNMGNLYLDMYDTDNALLFSEKAYDIQPKHPPIIRNLANKYRYVKRYDDAIRLYKELLRISPDDPDLLFNLGLIYMEQGDFKQGWPLYERRIDTNYYHFSPNWMIPKWDGNTDLNGKRVLLVAEQGFGDNIMLSRFIPQLKETGADIALKCQPELVRLFSTLPCKIQTERMIRQDQFDYYIPMMSLAYHFEQDWHKWPATPSFSIPAEASAKYEPLARHSQEHFKVGIVWSGSPAFEHNKRRALTLTPFLELVRHFPQMRFFSFQKGAPESELNECGSGTIAHLGGSFDDFADTAAALQHMDLIIMTDSALAHLAGSYDIPVLNMLDYAPYWIYLPADTKTPIYPSMRLLRQNAPNDWATPLEKLRTVLGEIDKLDYDQLSADKTLSLIDKAL